MDIYLNPEGADAVVKNVSAKAEELARVAGEITQLIEGDLPQEWRGKSSNEVQNTFSEQYKDFLNNKVPEMVKELKSYMDTRVKQLIEADAG